MSGGIPDFLGDDNAAQLFGDLMVTKIFYIID